MASIEPSRTGELTAESAGPILDDQPGNLAEVGQIPGDQPCAVDQADGRDLPIHGTDPDFFASEAPGLGGGAVFEVEDRAVSEIGHECVQLRIADRLTLELAEP